MPDEDHFEAFVRSGLARLGMSVDEVELAVMRYAEQVYGPDRDALMAADFSGVLPERGLDPSRAPAKSESR
jgi:hypothetical protein